MIIAFLFMKIIFCVFLKYKFKEFPKRDWKVRMTSVRRECLQSDINKEFVVVVGNYCVVLCNSSMEFQSIEIVLEDLHLCKSE